MVVDTSVLIAIIFEEPEAGRFRQMIEAHPHPVISAASYAEAGIVVTQRLRPAALKDLDIVLSGAGVEIVPVTEDQARLAIAAYARFGKGRHPAALNYGDCFSYALAQTRGEPLLAKGEDFVRSDVVMAAAG